ncbi:MAG TPA: hypothetical protein VK503_09335 [Candidatus Bathyarchaeia archaeon]|nr:hypothetical protein [Candidatus Bathyarchaeia archaeon]
MEIDIWRNAVLTLPHVREKIGTLIGIPFGFPACEQQVWQRIFSSITTYLACCRILALEILEVFQYEIVEMEQAKRERWLVEISPFLFTHWKQSKRVIWADLLPSPHSIRMCQKLQCTMAEAVAWVDFYRVAVKQIQVPFDVILPLLNPTSDELHFVLESF